MSFKQIHILGVLMLYLFPFGKVWAVDEHYQDLYSKANEAYQAGAYDSARSIYAEIVENGIVSSELFYNLGNTYFRLERIPEAILYYERAQRLDPSDADIQYNLEIARGFITDKISPIEEMFFVAWWNGLATEMGADTWAATFILLLFLFATLVTVFVTANERRLKQLGLIGASAVILGAVVVWNLALSAEKVYNAPAAIVFAPSVNVTSEPGRAGVDQFIIHEGLKVEVIDEQGDWTRIQLSDGNSGWLPSPSIEKI